MKKLFARQLLKWYHPDNRKMPWKGSKNPYVVWLSEIILQQTRVEQGLPYFNRFLEQYPTIHDLAKASEDEVLKLWQGLGYYSRARNMLATAKMVVQKFSGEFPADYNELIKLKGIGAYTASAIASFAFNQPHAVVDGNVFRVLSRYFGVKSPIDSTEGKKYFSSLAHELIDKKNPGRYNQAIMDFGAGQCKPQNPDCPHCPLKKSCIAFRTKQISSLPVKSKKTKQKIRYFNYLVINKGDSLLLQQRNGNDIWKKLYEFPLIETKEEIRGKKLKVDNKWAELFPGIKIKSVSPLYKQQLTHQKIFARFWEIEAKTNTVKNKEHLVVADKNILTKFAFPKIIFCYLKDKNYI